MNHSELSHMAGAIDDSTINIVVVIIIIIIIAVPMSRMSILAYVFDVRNETGQLDWENCQLAVCIYVSHYICWLYTL